MCSHTHSHVSLRVLRDAPISTASERALVTNTRCLFLCKHEAQHVVSFTLKNGFMWVMFNVYEL